MLVRWHFSLLYSLLMVSAVPAYSADGMVTVNGEVLLETCTINAGFPSFAVTLPTLATTAFTGLGSTAGGTRFSITLTNCTGLASKVNTYFEYGPTVNADGRLINTAAGGASVDGQIQNADGSIVNLAASSGLQNTTVTPILSQGATQNYTIAYLANALPVRAGAFSSSVVYTLLYQ